MARLLGNIMNFKLTQLFTTDTLCTSQMKKGDIGYIVDYLYKEYVGRPVMKGLDIVFLLDEGVNFTADQLTKFPMKVRLLTKNEQLIFTGV
jgi:hypothetical protein